jgi:CBS domain containing-hemolysin-like protein
MSGTVQVALIVLCLFGTGLFAGLETGIISIHRMRLRHLVRHGSKRAGILQSFLDDPDHLLGTTLVGTNLCMVTASVTAASFANRHLGEVGSWISGVAMALIILLGCEYLPKAWFQGHPAIRTLPFAGFMKMAGFILMPVSRFTMALTRLLFPAPARTAEVASTFVTKEELRHLSHETAAAGDLSGDERSMIHAVLGLSHLACRDLMVPSKNMARVPHDAEPGAILSLAYRRKLVRVPVFRQGTERFLGVLDVRDIVRDEHRESKQAHDYVRPIPLMREEVPADELLPRLRLARQSAALVTGSDGRVTGLICLDDVFDRIIGGL